MSGEDVSSEGFLCVTQQSANKLKFTISLSGNRGLNTDAKSQKDSEELVEVTGRNLYLVLCDIHNQLVRRDPRGIFANPVTDEIAAGYSQTISHPMDLGTIYTKLCSRSFYNSASEYLADVTLMCENAMVYNPPDTIYYQRARKLLAYCRKQMTPTALRKLCDSLELTGGLQDDELGDISPLTGAFPRHHRLGASHHRRLSSKESLMRSSSRINRVRSDRNWHGAARSTSTGGLMRFTGSRTTAGRCKRKVGRPRIRDRSFGASLLKKHDRRTSREAIGGSKCEVSTRSPTAESTPLPYKPVQVSSSTTKSKHQPTGRPRGRPRKIPRPPRTSPPPPLVTTESDTSLPNTPPHLSTISSSSPSSTSAARRTAGSCPSPISSTRADSPTARSISCVSDAPSTIASTGTVPLETSAGANATPAVPFTSSTQTVVTPTNSEPPCPILEPTVTISQLSVSDDSLPTPVVKRGRGRPPKCPRPVETTTPTPTEKLTVSPKRTKRRRLSIADTASPVKRRAATSQPVSPTTSPVEVADRTAVVVVAKAPVPKSDATTQVEDDVLEQARRAAQLAAERLRSKYARLSGGMQQKDGRIGPRTVYLDFDSPGQVNAVECPWVQSSQQLMRIDLGYSPPDHLTSDQHPMGTVNYPEVMNQILTGYRSRSAFAPEMDLENESAKSRDSNSRQKPYVPLVDPFNAEQLEELKQLGKLKYNPDEPISAAFHGPLAVFSPEELGQMAEIYGGDLNVMEYAFSLLTFVEPMGRWARRWVAKQLDAATDGLHSQFALGAKATELTSCREGENVESQFPMWMRTAGLTVDSPSPPCSPETDSHAAEFEDDSSTPLLHSLSQLDSSTLPSAEMSPPIKMDGQVVFTETADPGMTCVPPVPVPVATTTAVIPTSGEHVPVSVTYEETVSAVPKATAASSRLSPILTESSAKSSLLESTVTTSSYGGQVDVNGSVPQSCLITSPTTATDTQTPEDSTRSEYPTADSTQSDSATGNGIPNTRPEAVVEASKSCPRLDEVLTSPSVTPSNSLLKSALHAAGTFPAIVDRSTSLLVHIPISPNDTQKITPRLDSLLQHSPQVTVPSDVVVSGLRLEALGDTRPESKDANTSETEQEAVLLTTSEDSGVVVKNQALSDNLVQMSSFQVTEEVSFQLSSPSKKLNVQLSNESEQYSAETVKSEEVAEILGQPDNSTNQTQPVDQTCTSSQLGLKMDKEKPEPVLDSTSINRNPESSLSSIERLLTDNEELITLESAGVECKVKEDKVEKEPESSAEHKITETDSISSDMPQNLECEKHQIVMDSLAIPLKTEESTGSFGSKQSEGRTVIAKTDDNVSQAFSGNAVDSNEIQSLDFIQSHMASVIQEKAGRSAFPCADGPFTQQENTEATGSPSHSSEVDAVSDESTGLLHSSAKLSPETIHEASVDFLTIPSENITFFAATEPCSLEPIITALGEPMYSRCVTHPTVFSSSAYMHLEEATLLVPVEPCSLEPTTTDLEEANCTTLYVQPTVLSSTAIISHFSQKTISSEFEPPSSNQMTSLSGAPTSSGYSAPSPEASNPCEVSEPAGEGLRTANLFSTHSHTDQLNAATDPAVVVETETMKPPSEEKQCDLSIARSVKSTNLGLELEAMRSVHSTLDGSSEVLMCCHEETPTITTVDVPAAPDVVRGDLAEGTTTETKMICVESSEFTHTELAFEDTTTQISPTPMKDNDNNEDNNNSNTNE